MTLPPLLSVCVITYNHKEYIRQAVDSVLNQNVKFSWEVIIADDHSTDGTTELLKEYKEKFPKLVRLILQPQQVGPGRNWRDLLFASEAKYIAYLEGDDYWTDVHKLSKQVAFLEANEGYVMTFGNAQVLDLTGAYHKKGKYLVGGESQSFGPTEAIEIGCPSLSMVFRNHVKLLPDWLFEIRSGDYFLRLLLSLHGRFYYFDEIFGVHRKMSTGISRLNSRLMWYLNSVEGLKRFKLVCLPEQRDGLKKKIAVFYVYAFVYSLYYARSRSVELFFKMSSSKGFYTRNGIGNLRSLLWSVFVTRRHDRFDIF